jgi:hypothetical protein
MMSTHSKGSTARTMKHPSMNNANVAPIAR